MKSLPFLFIAFLSAGCASTTLYDGRGHKLAHIQGDATGLAITGPGVSLTAATLSHSPATLAGGKAFTTGAGGVAKVTTALGAAVATHGLVP